MPFDRPTRAAPFPVLNPANAAAPGPLAAYRARLAEGGLAADPAQAAAAVRLQALHDALRREPGVRLGRRERFARLLGRRRPEEAPRGVYLHGPVGRGKTMLMDAFFEEAPVAAKRRVHFHAFMLDVHARLHALRREAAVADPLKPLAAALTREARLLCFDEFDVEDVADAMILGRLFERMFARGVVVVATSNRAPDALYANGLQRPLFLPFIALLKERCEVVGLGDGRDFRLDRRRGTPAHVTPLGAATTAALEAAFAALADGAPGGPEEIGVGARRLRLARAAGGVAFASFEELCARPLGAADYLALAERFETVILDGVPRLSPSRRDEARRFATLVDVFYERRRRLVLGAEAPAEELYPEGDAAFVFRRTVSRLAEMGSEGYPGAPEPAVTR